MLWGIKLEILLLQNFSYQVSKKVFFFTEFEGLNRFETPTFFVFPLSFSNYPTTTRLLWSSVCAHEEKAFAGKKKRASPLYSSLGWEREHYTAPVFISISHQIRSLADKSTSWHITSSLRRKLTRAGNPKRQAGGGEDEEVKLFMTEGREREWKGEIQLEDKEHKYIGGKMWNLHTRGLDPQCCVGRGGEEGGRVARDKEVKRH